jgi:hypothetical protein
MSHLISKIKVLTKILDIHKGDNRVLGRDTKQNMCRLKYGREYWTCDKPRYKRLHIKEYNDNNKVTKSIMITENRYVKRNYLLQDPFFFLSATIFQPVEYALQSDHSPPADRGNR